MWLNHFQYLSPQDSISYPLNRKKGRAMIHQWKNRHFSTDVPGWGNDILEDTIMPSISSASFSSSSSSPSSNSSHSPSSLSYSTFPCSSASSSRTLPSASSLGHDSRPFKDDDTSLMRPRRARGRLSTSLLLDKVVLTLTVMAVVMLMACCHTATAYISDDLVVETNKGKIRGVTLKSATNKDVDVWYGIPYAQPPLGNLRFRHPRPIDAWSGIKETTKLPNSCIQIYDTAFPGFYGSEMWNANTPISEDCLYINVAVPKPHPKNSAVLVWVFGGGFYSGSSTLDVYDMRVLASEENIILVSFQYRVASLGFLFFDTEDVPGNAAMFDQIMALQWIKDNIAHFGGNPDNITLFGESAGATSVSLHLLSPLSRNLFSQVIMQSASALVPWGIITKEESLIRGLRLAELMNCPHDRLDLRATIECLRQKNATEMVNKEWDGIVFGICEFPFVPIIDGSFLDETPQTAVDSENFKKTNILMGTNQDEAFFFIMYYLGEIFKNEESVHVTREDFLKLVSETNLYVKQVGREAIIYEYTDWLNPNNAIKNRDAIDKMVGDYAFTCPVVEFGYQYASSGNNVYMYYFSERASTNPWPTWAGVLHGDEIAFIFGEPLNRSRNYDQSEIALSRRMMAYWANFAKTGNPSLSADGTWATTYWPRHTADKREVLELNANYTRTLNGLRVKKCAFWSEFLPKLLASESPRPCDKSCCKSVGGEVASSSATSGVSGFSIASSSDRFTLLSMLTLLAVITQSQLT
ncbi:acetylcholinesterase-like isoform X2 [Tigriopus californicus]|uniref:acetylcholinesterase-like isoform X2 n=1 Tax=Tigriopus californicus TaxID=6832 RepID=UPI0027DA1B2B|nr:acetylcholinesterase-like isoform X2 [Tigriopus californicus]